MRSLLLSPSGSFETDAGVTVSLGAFRALKHSPAFPSGGRYRWGFPLGGTAPYTQNRNLTWYKQDVVT